METKDLAALPEPVRFLKPHADYFTTDQMHAHYLKGREDDRAESAARIAHLTQEHDLALRANGAMADRIAELERHLRDTLGTPDNDWCPECHARESGQDDVRLAALEEAASAVRYYLKHQDHPVWDRCSEYQKGVQVTAENIEKAIRALKTQPADANAVHLANAGPSPGDHTMDRRIAALPLPSYPEPGAEDGSKP